METDSGRHSYSTLALAQCTEATMLHIGHWLGDGTTHRIHLVCIRAQSHTVAPGALVNGRQLDTWDVLLHAKRPTTTQCQYEESVTPL